MTEHSLWPRRTPRLELRIPSLDDLDQVLTWRNDPAVTRWMLSTTVDPDSWRSAWLAGADDPFDHSVVAVLHGRVIGTGSIEVADAMGQGMRAPNAADLPWRSAQGSLGYLLDPTVHGRGLATEIVAAMLDLAFDLGLHRVTAGCFADNIGSWRVMEKFGMRREQHGVQDSWHAEMGWLDGYTYAILAEEWRAAAPAATAVRTS